ncbi:TPA: hypothetical protein QCS32_006127 [Bacillus thuringiensis]|nr:hypothetical protein [Bacillus thuringiensis]
MGRTTFMQILKRAYFEIYKTREEDIILVAVSYYCRFSQSAGFQLLRHCLRTIKGIETVHALYKKKRIFQLDSAFLVYHEFQ